jgi:hypothetical protein
MGDGRPPPAPELVELAKALARAAVARDFDSRYPKGVRADPAPRGASHENRHLRPLQLRAPE